MRCELRVFQLDGRRFQAAIVAGGAQRGDLPGCDPDGRTLGYVLRGARSTVGRAEVRAERAEIRAQRAHMPDCDSSGHGGGRFS